MANTITIQTLRHSDTEIVYKFTIEGDGSGEEIGTTTNTIAIPVTARLVKIQSCLSGFSALLAWEGSSDIMCIQLPSDGYIDIDYTRIGGIKNNATAPTGDIAITTSGLGAYDSGHVVITMSI